MLIRRNPDPVRQAGEIRRSLAAVSFAETVVQPARADDPAPDTTARCSTAAGVAAEEVAEEYVLTAGCPSARMLDTLTHLDQRYGGAVPYLVKSGVQPGLLAAVRDRLLEPPGGKVARR